MAKKKRNIHRSVTQRKDVHTRRNVEKTGMSKYSDLIIIIAIFLFLAAVYYWSVSNGYYYEPSNIIRRGLP